MHTISKKLAKREKLARFATSEQEKYFEVGLVSRMRRIRWTTAAATTTTTTITLRIVHLSVYIRQQKPPLLGSTRRPRSTPIKYGIVWYGIVGFNVPLDTLYVISETILQVR